MPVVISPTLKEVPVMPGACFTPPLQDTMAIYAEMSIYAAITMVTGCQQP